MARRNDDRGAHRLGVFEARAGDEPILPSEFDVTDPRSSFFVDGRNGVDRWGRERSELVACGTGFDSYVCPLYLEESCPGDRNRGDRIDINYKATCDLDCGACGGGGRTETLGVCGQEKGLANMQAAIAEMGGSLRLDKWTAQPARDVFPWPCGYFPVVEWYAKNWSESLRELPMIGTTMQSVYPGRRGSRPTLLRDRLGGFDGRLVVTGLVKDDLLDDVWDDLPHVIAYCRASGVDVMVAPQYSYYDQEPNGMAVYNSNRILSYYSRCVDAGFPVVALDMPPFATQWLHEEFFNFVVRSQVKCVALSYQTFRTRGALDPRHVVGARRIHEALDPDVAVMVFGVGTALGMATLNKLFPGRKLVFSGKEPYARAIFYQLMPYGGSAPAGVKKPEVFARNVAWAQSTAKRVMTRRADGAGRPRRRRRR